MTLDLAKHTNCPIRELITRLGDKWSILVIVALSRAPGSRNRFSVLRKSIPGISQRMLTMTLRNLERDGLLTRHYYAEIPPRVEYQLTALGKGILVPMEALLGWIEGQWPQIEAARSAFDRALVPSVGASPASPAAAARSGSRPRSARAEALKTR